MSTKISSIGLLDLLEERDLIITVNGGSMVPTIVKGDRVHIKRTSGPVGIGTLVLCVDIYGKHMIHRVVAVAPSVVTRGDALDSDDAPIAKTLGIVTWVEKTWNSRLRRISLTIRGAIHGGIFKITGLGL